VNFRLVFKQLGLVLMVLSAAMVLSDLAVWVMPVRHATPEEAETAARVALFLAAGLGLAVGGALWLTLRRTTAHLGRREALLMVALSWLVGAALAAAPFLFWAHLVGEEMADHPFRTFINCYFEAMSGLTTTGATVLKDIEAVAPSLLFWRALTHWLGGLGIVLLFVAILPSLGVGGKRLFRIEAPGPEPEGVRPHIRDTARTLWYIYLGLTVVEILALILIGRLDLYHACCHTFATLATGGFSTRNASVGAHESLPVDVIIIIFMIFAGANFGLYYQVIRRKWKSFFGDTELRVYLSVMFIGALLVIGATWASVDPITLTTGEKVESNLGNSIRQGLFTTVAIKTTTGFCTADFNQWPFLARAVLVMLMFIGGSAGSTAGGIKVIRVWIAFRVMIAEVEKAFRPNVVRPIRVGGAKVDTDLKLSAIAFLVGIIVLFALGAGAVMLLEQAFGDGTCDFTTAATASVATLCTIGPGLGKIGAVENYGWLSDASKIVLSLLMALGRLEIFAILVLFTPRFWKSD
jgi:trk system potassium uptake protein TrkH